ncbi:hypothetical protein [Fuchsiella alkaliacetigena]|uniref:hypothetical protein n=1 Tax=Fuchsiella alkaliacetigena TaxID=957042 RepID=UPI00200B2485|nr:hypothetical protein [Fuchsiella alkaliacetigena]MCK8823879.1 hypothetical protein [Fuchsiella alkaliacetigena]
MFNEIRSEILTSNYEQDDQEGVKFIHNPQHSDFLEQISEPQLIKGIVSTLKYFIEYEKEYAERGV